MSCLTYRLTGKPRYLERKFESRVPRGLDINSIRWSSISTGLLIESFKVSKRRQLKLSVVQDNRSDSPLSGCCRTTTRREPSSERKGNISALPALLNFAMEPDSR